MDVILTLLTEEFKAAMREKYWSYFNGRMKNVTMSKVFELMSLRKSGAYKACA